MFCCKLANNWIYAFSRTFFLAKLLLADKKYFLEAWFHPSIQPTRRPSGHLFGRLENVPFVMLGWCQAILKLVCVDKTLPLVWLWANCRNSHWWYQTCSICSVLSPSQDSGARVSKTRRHRRHAWEKFWTFWENFGLTHYLCCLIFWFVANLEKKCIFW